MALEHQQGFIVGRSERGASVETEQCPRVVEATGMKRTAIAADRAVDLVLCHQGDLITRSQALGAGLTENALRHRLSARGPWWVVLPGVYITHSGELTSGQREIAAVLYAGRSSIITGYCGPAPAGCACTVVRHGRCAHSSREQAAEQRASCTCTGPPDAGNVRGSWTASSGPLRHAPLQTLLEAQRDVREVRALVADAVQRRKCTVAADRRRTASRTRTGISGVTGSIGGSR